MTARSRGQKHMIIDCWRYYADGIWAMTAFSGLIPRYAHTEFPKRRPGRVFEVDSYANVEDYCLTLAVCSRSPSSAPHVACR